MLDLPLMVPPCDEVQAEVNIPLAFVSLLSDHSRMTEVRKTPQFPKWLDNLKDVRAYARIETRLFRLALGLPGDVKPVGKGVY